MAKPSWFRRLFGGSSKPARRPSATAGPSSASTSSGEPPHEAPPLVAAPGVGNIDRAQHLEVVLASPEEDVLFDIGQRIDQGRFDLPHLPSSSIAALDSTSKPDADVAQVVALISTDPLLCSELLKTANSVLFAAEKPATNLHEAVMRLGLRQLRSLIFSVNMRSAILKGRGLTDYAAEVWRQALSVASIARAIGPEVGVDAERAFVVGLLQDIGKIALLTLLRQEAADKGVSSALVGRVFHAFHERVGRAVAETWKLPEELHAVCGCHHGYADAGEHARSAALACLAHQLDLYQSLADEQGFRHLVQHPVFEFLGVPENARRRVLEHAREAYDQNRSGLEAAA